jgi:Flp pilus assembly protein TadD
VFVQAQNGQLMRPDSQLYIVPFEGGKARRLNANLPTMNSWHSWSPNGRWLVFSSKSRGPYTRMYLTHIDEEGNDSPAIYIDNVAAANRAVNIPEFVNISADGMLKIATPAVDMYKQFDHAFELGEAGNDAAAIAEWRELAAAYPDDARVQSNLGSELAKTGRHQEAVVHFKKALGLNPQFNSVHGALAGALMKTGHLDEALAQFQTALEIYPASADLHNGYGSALVKNGQIAEATTEFLRSTELNPRLVEAQNNLGIAFARQGRSNDAVDRFRKAIDIDRDYAEAHNNLGIAVLSGDVPNPTEAESEFKAAIELKKHYADAECNLGNLYWQERRNREAEQMYRQSIESDQRFVKAYLGWASMLIEEGRLGDAEGVLSRGQLAVPGNAAIEGLQRQVKDQIRKVR